VTGGEESLGAAGGGVGAGAAGGGGGSTAAAGGIAILPYSRVVGQHDLKLALELNFVSPSIGGVLITGAPGTAKSTVVRAFSLMTQGRLPVTLTIDATDDRVLGGWELGDLLEGRTRRKRGLLETADDDGLLYVDEVNLLNDHVVNIILDVASTGVLSVQREGIDTVRKVRFGLVGTMNPEEGLLRPQLLDRFGLMAVASALDEAERRAMLHAVLRFDEELARPGTAPSGAPGRDEDEATRARLLAARAALFDVDVPEAAVDRAVATATALRAVGHRGEVVMIQAARARAALLGDPAVRPAHLRAVARFALRHRKPESAQGGAAEWSAEDEAILDDLLS
jgi:magnesium chelatase subunit I